MDRATKFGIFLAVLAIGISIVAAFAPYLWKDVPRNISWIGVIAGLIIVIGSVLLLFALPDAAKPDVRLTLVNPKAPQLRIENISREVAPNIKWEIMAFNLTRIKENRQPLPIPATTFDFLTPANASLPANVFERPLVKPLIQEGDRVIGSMSVNCPNCIRGHTYLFEFVWGKGGWYAEHSEIDNGNLLGPASMNLVEEFAQETISKLPTSIRVPIAPRN